MGAKDKETASKEGTGERASRFFRNINVIGAVALGGASIVAPPLAALAGLNAVQAGGFEALRRHEKKKRLKKKSKGV